MTTSPHIDVPDAFAASYGAHGAEERAWIAGLPRLGGEFLERWGLRPDGPAAHGMASLVLPVLRADGTPAVLKLQRLREETAGAAAGLRAWNGDGIVRLLDHDERSGTQLLERLDAARPLSSVADDGAALRILAELLARLTAMPAPEGVRGLAGVAAAMLDQVPRAVRALRDPGERRLVRVCASAVAELAGEPGDRLLHWDLHYDNVLAGEREPLARHRPGTAGRRPRIRAAARLGQPVGRGGGHRRRRLRGAPPLRPAYRGRRTRPEAGGRLDPRPRVAERAVGRRRRQDGAGSRAGRHRHGRAHPLG